MVKLHFILVTFFISSIFLISCNKSDEVDNPESMAKLFTEAVKNKDVNLFKNLIISEDEFLDLMFSEIPEDQLKKAKDEDIKKYKIKLRKEYKQFAENILNRFKNYVDLYSNHIAEYKSFSINPNGKRHYIEVITTNGAIGKIEIKKFSVVNGKYKITALNKHPN